MEIKDFYELNALNKLLWKIKFQEDLDFHEFNEFASSPIISSIFDRINREFNKRAIDKGILNSDNKLEFKFENYFGKSVKRRIDELDKNSCRNLAKLAPLEFENYLRILISPLEVSNYEFDRLRNYANEKIKST